MLTQILELNTLPCNNNNTNTNYKELFLEKDNNGREIWIYHLNNVSLTGHSLYYPNVLLYSGQSPDDNTELYIPYKERTMSLNQGSIYEKNNMQYDIQNTYSNICSQNVCVKTMYNEPVFFFIYNTDNYYHFIYDTLPVLITFNHLKQRYPILKLLMNYPNNQCKRFYKFILETLELFNLQDSYIIADEHQNVIFKHIIVSTSYTHDFDSNLPPRIEIYDLYKSMVSLALKYTDNTTNANNANNAHNSSNKFSNKIYISRRSWVHNDLSNIGTNYTTRRALMNETELVEKLAMCGIKEVFTENMSMIEKIILFANAEVVIGAIGGGIANVVFSNPNTKLITLVSPGFLNINSRFKYCLDIVDNIYFTDCSHFEKTPFKKYMRVKININSETLYNKKEVLGEIEDIIDEELVIKSTDGSNTGWNSLCNYNIKRVKNTDVILLDDGLNSAWIVDDIDKIFNHLGCNHLGFNYK